MNRRRYAVSLPKLLLEGLPHLALRERTSRTFERELLLLLLPLKISVECRPCRWAALEWRFFLDSN